jgi:malonate transporter
VAVGPLTAATAGTGLFLTGLMLSAKAIRIDANGLLSTAIKTVMQPALAFGFALLFGLSGRGLAEAVLLCTSPAGFFGLVFGASVGLRPQVAGSTLVLSSIVSVVTLSAVILMVGGG